MKPVYVVLGDESDEKAPLVSPMTHSDATQPNPYSTDVRNRKWGWKRIAVVGGISIASIFATLFTIAMLVQVTSSPDFCHDLDCPPFEIVETLPIKSVELRSYPPTTWVSTNTSGISYDKAVTDGFMRLFRYISGENMPQKKVAMTAPVIVEVVPGPGPTCGTDFIVSFYSPTPTPPEPSSKLVYIEQGEAAKYYVLTFGGWATEREVLKKAQELTDILTSLGRKFDASSFITAGYDSPFRLLRRHNEIAFVALP